MRDIFPLIVLSLGGLIGYKIIVRRAELGLMFSNTLEAEVREHEIVFNSYPFGPSFAFKQNKVSAVQINDIDAGAFPPTIRVGSELLFLPANKKGELQMFGENNHIPVVSRADIWGWISEPFLDTEYTDIRHKEIIELLGGYGLSEEEVAQLRLEVKEPMLRYNFESMLWEWVNLNAFDVLCAMRAKYNRKQFADFYDKVMKVALLDKEESKGEEVARG